MLMSVGTSDLVITLTSFMSKYGLWSSLFGTVARVLLDYFVLFSGACNFFEPF